MDGEDRSEDEQAKVYFDLRSGAPSPSERRDPVDGWGPLGSVIEDDSDGFVVVDVAPGKVLLPAGVEGRLTLRIRAPGLFEVTLGPGDYQLVIELHCDGAEINLGFDAQRAPVVHGASMGPNGVSPLVRNSEMSGLRRLEVVGILGTPHAVMRKVMLRPGIALLARAASLAVRNAGLRIEDLPSLESLSEPTPVLLTGDSELVLASAAVDLPEAQRLPCVRVVGPGLPFAGPKVDIDRLHVAAGCRYSLQTNFTVGHCVLHQASRLKIAPYSIVSEIVAEADSRNGHLSLAEYPPTIEVPSRVDRKVSSVGSIVGPARVLLSCAHPHKAEKWRPAELWIQRQVEAVVFAVEGGRYRRELPPTVRFMPTSSGRAASFDVAIDDRGDHQVAMYVGLHMAERAGLYEARGEVVVRQALDATIDGTADEGLRVVGIAPPETTPFDDPEPEDRTDRQTSVDEKPELFAGSRMTDIRIDLDSDEALSILQDLRTAEVFEPHPSVWSASGRPFGLPPVDRSELTRTEEWWFNPRRQRRRPGRDARQRDLALSLLHDVTSERGRSGTVRSGLARAALVKRQQRSRFWTEHVLLLAGRPLGFGYLIGRAAIVWIAVSVLIAVLALGSGGFDPTLTGLGRLVGGVLSVATEPFGILRGVRAQTWLEAQVNDDQQYLATLARVAVSAPLVSMFVAISRRVRPRRK